MATPSSFTWQAFTDGQYSIYIYNIDSPVVWLVQNHSRGRWRGGDGGFLNRGRGAPPTHRFPELCESRGSHLGFPVPNSPCGLCGRTTAFEEEEEEAAPQWQQCKSAGRPGQWKSRRSFPFSQQGRFVFPVCFASMLGFSVCFEPEGAAFFRFILIMPQLNCSSSSILKTECYHSYSASGREYTHWLSSWPLRFRLDSVWRTARWSLFEENPELPKSLPLKPEVGQNIATHASLADRIFSPPHLYIPDPFNIPCGHAG